MCKKLTTGLLLLLLLLVRERETRKSLGILSEHRSPGDQELDIGDSNIERNDRQALRISNTSFLLVFNCFVYLLLPLTINLLVPFKF